MKIISHRGYWKDASEKNNEIAFARSFCNGFGTETDIRDCNNDLVVSHDVPTGSELRLGDLLEIAINLSTETSMTLALNVKSDGIAVLLNNEIKQYPQLDCFVFDMSVPDMRSYLEIDVPVFTRMSEVEIQPVWLNKAVGVWLDAFETDWYTLEQVSDLLLIGKRVGIVSPELHGRPHLSLWNKLLPLRYDSRLILCTDFPEDAARYFS